MGLNEWSPGQGGNEAAVLVVRIDADFLPVGFFYQHAGKPYKRIKVFKVTHSHYAPTKAPLGYPAPLILRV